MKYFRARDIPVAIILASVLFLTACTGAQTFQVRETAATASASYPIVGNTQGTIGGCEIILPDKDDNTIELKGELNIKYQGEKCNIDYLQLSK